MDWFFWLLFVGIGKTLPVEVLFKLSHCFFLHVEVAIPQLFPLFSIGHKKTAIIPYFLLLDKQK